MVILQKPLIGPLRRKTKKYWLYASFVAAWCAGFGETAHAILQQTQADLAVLEDRLRFEVEQDEGFANRISPLLLAPPLHHWQESRADFSASLQNTLSASLPEIVKILPCTECDRWRMHVSNTQTIQVINGEIALSELHELKKDVRYREAKAYAMASETPSGVEFKIVDINSGAILFAALADSSKDLNQVKPYFGLAAERDRRLSGESLNYVFINAGLYPTGLFQMEFVEQWGSRNQHISGLGLSLFNPTFALGAVYHYILPKTKRLHVSGALYYPLANALASALPDDEETLTGGFVVQGMVQYSFANSYGAFVSLSTEGTFSIGLNMYNPLILPFLL